MALGGGGPSEQQDSAPRLNDVDRFQSAILSVLDQLEHLYRSTAAEQENGSSFNEVKLEEKDEGQFLVSQVSPLLFRTLTRSSEGAVAAPQTTKIQRYMLHRTLPSGVDVFTSAAVLSDKDLDALSKSAPSRCPCMQICFVES